MDDAVIPRKRKRGSGAADRAAMLDGVMLQGMSMLQK
jgi:hypothetical protein